MKIIHSSDWHLGRKLYSRSRYDEFQLFLDHLAQYIEENAIDALIVAGDIFDTGSPSNRAQQQYYRFLKRLSESPCQQVIITGGNHDSPSFLNAPKELLSVLSVSVVAAVSDNLEDEIIILKDQEGKERAILCAVPYLRDRDLRQSESGESTKEKEQKIAQGIRQHYAEVVALAEKKNQELEENLPILATGHLFAHGGKTHDGDGVRDLYYVGNLGQIGIEAFPNAIDYLALGHLHVPQKLADSDRHRYCGSPLPMCFGEATQQKLFIELEIQNTEISIQEIPLPCFQKLVQIRGGWQDIEHEIEILKKEEQNIWLEVIYQGDELISDLPRRLEELCQGSNLEILRMQNRRLVERALKQMNCDESLENLKESDVFERRLNDEELSEEQAQELRQDFQWVMQELQESE